MPMPRWFANLNKRTFNRRELTKGKRPVLTHTGRASGAVYHTPLDAHAVPGGYMFILVYGAQSDWVQNVLASGSASLLVDGKNIPLAAPRLLSGESAWDELPAGTKRPPGFLNVSELLRMDVAA